MFCGKKVGATATESQSTAEPVPAGAAAAEPSVGRVSFVGHFNVNIEYAKLVAMKHEKPRYRRGPNILSWQRCFVGQILGFKLEQQAVQCEVPARCAEAQTRTLNIAPKFCEISARPSEIGTTQPLLKSEQDLPTS